MACKAPNQSLAQALQVIGWHIQRLSEPAKLTAGTCLKMLCEQPTESSHIAEMLENVATFDAKTRGELEAILQPKPRPKLTVVTSIKRRAG